MITINKLSKLYVLKQQSIDTYKNVINTINFDSIIDKDFFITSKLTISEKIFFYLPLKPYLNHDQKLSFEKDLIDEINNAQNKSIHHIIDWFMLLETYDVSLIKNTLKNDLLDFYIARTSDNLLSIANHFDDINQASWVFSGFLYSIYCFKTIGLIKNISDLKIIIPYNINNTALNHIIKIIYEADTSLCPNMDFDHIYALSNTLNISILDHLIKSEISITEMDIT